MQRLCYITFFENIQSILCTPLIYNNRVIGVVQVINKRDEDYNYEDEKLFRSLADQAAISISQCHFLDNQKSDLIHITSLLIEAQDRFNQVKKGHGRSVANYANLIGKKMGLSEEKLKVLYNASLLHDIGFLKIVIKDPRKLTPLDIEKAMTHPRIGYDMIKPISLWDEAAEIILSHHERYDGAGYPMQKKGDEIPLEARILFIAEVFDVLTSKSSYRKQLDTQSAINEITANSGTQFDPKCVKAFQAAMAELDT